MQDSNKAQNPRQREFFDNAAATWDDTVQHDMEKLEEIVGQLDLAPGEAVMDVGTGTGVAIPLLTAKVGPEGSVRGVDYSPEMLAIARQKHPPERFPSVEFYLGDVTEMNMDGELDAVLCYSCFPHFLDQAGALKNLAAGLRPGGRLMVAHSQSRDGINSMHREVDEAVQEDHLPTLHEIKAMMEAAGLEFVLGVDNEEMFYLVSRRPGP